MRKFGVILLAVAAMFGLAACDRGNESTADKETKVQQSGYARLSENQPASTMDYSPTRETINYWVDTWDEPGKLSYVYLQASNGQLVGYYIFRGLPVSYCAMLTPTYRFENVDGGQHDADVMVPAPGVDGAYYSGNQCNAYYGIDATTDSYIEYTVGTGISALVYEQPLPRQDVEPLGFTTVDDVK